MHFEGPFLHVSGMTKPLLANNATMMVESPAGGFRFTLYRLVERLKSRGVYQVFPKGVSIKGLARGLGKFLLNVWRQVRRTGEENPPQVVSRAHSISRPPERRDGEGELSTPCNEAKQTDPPPHAELDEVGPFSPPATADANECRSWHPARTLKSTVLVIDDEEGIRHLIKAKLTREGRDVLLAANGEDGLKLFSRERPDITLLDLHMPGMSGLEVLRKIRRIRPAAIVMIFTGDQSEAAVREAQRLGVTEFLQKGESFQDAWERRTRRL